MYENLIITTENGIRTILVNRPLQLNALNKNTISELNQILIGSDADASVGVIIISGQGEKAFVAGADIKEFADFSISEGGTLSKTGHVSLFNLIESLSKPVIAAINGFALGGGLELALCCHFRIASKNAKLGLPEVSLGLIPGYGGTQRLAQIVGKGRAFEMIFTAGMISAEEAYRIGLVNHVVESSDLLTKAMEIGQKIMRNSPSAIAAAIVAVNAGFTDGINGYDAEIEEFGKCFGTKDFKTGTNAFLSKEKPSFRGK